MKLLFSSAAYALLATANATVLLNDTFADLDRTNPSLPDSGRWVIAGSGATSTSASAATGALVSQLSAGFTLSTSFGSQPLAVGQTITASFSVTFGFNGTPSADAFRFGLYNSGGSFPANDGTASNGANSAYNAWTGYSYWSPFGSVSGADAALRERTGTSDVVAAAGANTVGNSTAYPSGSIVNSTTYTGSLSITNNGSSLAITANLGGNSLSWTDTSPTATTFDSLSFYSGSTPLGTNGSFTLDNVVVQVIPEPSSLLLAGIAPLALLRRRR